MKKRINLLVVLIYVVPGYKNKLFFKDFKIYIKTNDSLSAYKICANHLLNNKSLYLKFSINHGETWMSMIESRIQTSHTYNESVTSDIAQDIINNYYNRLKELETKLEKLAQENN